MASEATNTLDSFFECPICLEEFNDPRLLPCHHTLCMECLAKHVSTTYGDTFGCPTCRYECTVPAEGIAAMPRNFFLNSLREHLTKTETKMTGAKNTPDAAKRECHYLKTVDTFHGDVAVFCDDCRQFYCENCTPYHNGFVSSAHSLRPADEADPSEVRQGHLFQKMRFCVQHPRFELDFYCDECLVPVCTKCCLLKHKQHAYRDLSTAGQECQGRLSLLLQAANAHIAHLQKHCGSLEDCHNDIQRDFAKASLELHLAANEVRDMVTKREQCLQKELSESEEEALQSVRAAQKEAELNMATMQSLLSYVQPLQASGSDVDKLLHLPGLQQLFKEHQSSQLSKVCWTANIKREGMRAATLGTVEMESRSTTNYIAPKQLELGPTLNTMTPDVGNDVVGLVVAGSVVCAAGVAQPYLWVFDSITNEHKKHKIGRLRAAGMTAVKAETLEGELTVVLTDYKKKLHFVTVDKSSLSIRKQTTKDIDFEPYRISTDSETGKLVIANMKERQIVLSDENGKTSALIGVGRMICVTGTSSGYVVVESSNEGRIHWVDDQGNAIHSYGDGDGESLRRPPQLAQDSQGRLVVVDSGNHRLHLLEAGGQLCGYLLAQAGGIRHPSCVFLDESSSRLYVAHAGHRGPEVRAYKWPPSPSTLTTYFTLDVQLGS